MTGYTVHTGSTEKFSEGWDRIFQGKKIRKESAKSTASKPKPSADTKPRKKK